MLFPKKEPIIRRYPLLTVDGKDVCMNVRIRKRIKFLDIDTWPDAKLDEPISDCVFRYLCVKNGIMYAMNKAFYDYFDPGRSQKASIQISPIWLGVYSITEEHMEHIIENALPHWEHAGRIIETWLAGRKWDVIDPREMVRELYDKDQYFQCENDYRDWDRERFEQKKKLRWSW